MKQKIVCWWERSNNETQNEIQNTGKNKKMTLDIFETEIFSFCV